MLRRLAFFNYFTNIWGSCYVFWQKRIAFLLCLCFKKNVATHLLHVLTRFSNLKSEDVRLVKRLSLIVYSWSYFLV